MRIKKMTRFIEENYLHPITLEQIALEASVGRRECCRVFSRQLGCSPVDYLIDIRISRAQNLLESSDLKIDAVAQACGFSSSNYFCRIFKQRTRGCQDWSASHNRYLAGA
ncbi:MAG: helix-turn-helix transcriptional regulator [Treponema sp.]|nr:helix-turn-helix transcriptional regulator [Treponema sp.]